MARVGDRIRPMTAEDFAALKAITPKQPDVRIAEALERIAAVLEADYSPTGEPSSD